MSNATHKQTIWDGSRICDICMKPVGDKLIDGATLIGPWAVMCVPCSNKYGVGLGQGQGQLYQLQGSEFVKVQG